MSKKILSLIQAIIQLLALILLFIPITFKQDYSESGYLLGSPVNRSFSISAFEAGSETNNLIWVILLTILFVASIAYFVLYYTTDIPYLKKKYCIAIPCAPVLFMIISAATITSFSLSYDNGEEYYVFREYYHIWYKLNWGFFLLCALVLSVICLELFKHFSKLPEVKEKVSATETAKTSLDGVEKLKDLLDKGIISEEEFEAKKKQLLGL